MRTSLLFVLVILCSCSLIEQKRPSASKKNSTAIVTEAQSSSGHGSSPVSLLLKKAEMAYQKDRLMIPESDNAFDRYQAVLLLEPSNQVALMGLSNVSSRYCELAGISADRGDRVSSLAYLVKANLAKENHPCIARIEKYRPHNKSQVTRSTAAGLSKAGQFKLSLQDLRKKNQRIKDRLSTIAVRAKEKGVSLLIVARSDAEGRWIYSEMRKGVPGYRLRGNIQMGRQPVVAFGPSLSEL